MGTKLQYAINPILNDTSFAANHLEDPNIKRSAFHKFEYYSMDKILEQHNIESIKKTMLIHEGIFQHQVRELHRLYNVQKRVIDEMKNEMKQNRFRGPPMVDQQHSHLLNRHQQTSSSTSGYILHFQGVRDKDNIIIPSPREQSGSCSGETLRKPIKGFDLERPAEEAISIDEAQTGPCPCGQIHPRNNNIMCIGRYDESTDVELTLSIGRSNNISGKKRSTKSHDYEDHQRGDQELGCSTDLAHSKLDSGNNNAMSSTSSSSTIIEQQNKSSHWLFQGLSLNRS